MIETVFLDAGGVLVNPNWDRVAAALGGHGVASPPPPWKRRSRTRRSSSTPARPSRPPTTARAAGSTSTSCSQHAGIALSPATEAALRELAEYHARFNLWESVPREVPDALDRLRAAGHRLVVVSNANGTLHKHFARLDLARHFDVLIDSHDEGVEKPDPRIFQLALERSGARPETTLHAGDFYHVDVVGARAAGLQAWLIDAGGLYADHDVTRAPSLAVMVDRLLTA